MIPPILSCALFHAAAHEPLAMLVQSHSLSLSSELCIAYRSICTHEQTDCWMFQCFTRLWSSSLVVYNINSHSYSFSMRAERNKKSFEYNELCVCLYVDSWGFFRKEMDGINSANYLILDVFLSYTHIISLMNVCAAQNDDFFSAAFCLSFFPSFFNSNCWSFLVFFFFFAVLYSLSLYPSYNFYSLNVICMCFLRESREKKYKGWRICDRMRELKRGSKNTKKKNKNFDALFTFILIRP